jgi:DNA-binding response OmpR family regulator
MYDVAHPGGLDVLLVEDEKTLVEMYCLRLSAEGYQVRVASDGLSGLAAALRQPPDLLLLDIRLPGLSGLDLLDQLRRAMGTAVLPVIVISNSCEREVIERGRMLGALEHLVKSQTTPAALVEAIRRHLPQGPSAPIPA